MSGEGYMGYILACTVAGSIALFTIGPILFNMLEVGYNAIVSTETSIEPMEFCRSCGDLCTTCVYRCPFNRVLKDDVCVFK